MLNSVEKFRKIHIDAMTIAVANRALNLFDCFLSRAFRSKPETRFGEVWIEDRCQDLWDGLLDESIDHVWNTEISLACHLSFGMDLRRAGPGWYVPSSSCRSNVGPVLTKVFWEVVERDSVGPRGSTVGFDFPGVPCCPSRQSFHQVR